MKKHIIILAAIFAAALLAPACQPEDLTGMKSDGLTISLFSDDPETKAFDPTFETYIDHFDFFFFSNEDGTTPIPGMHGHVNGETTTLDTRPGQTYAALRKIESYVYILANYPGTIDHHHDWTLEQLLALDVNDQILTAKATATNPVTGKTEETGAVTFSNHLVMDSYHKDINLEEKHTIKIEAPRSVNERRTVTVGLSRLAAKLQMIVNVEPSVTGSLSGEVWTPVMSDFKAYYVNALNNKATVAGTPIERTSAPTGSEYITYPTAYPVTISGNTATTDPAFTYPQTWAVDANGDPYFKIQMTWRSNLRGTSPFYYKVRVPRAAADGMCTLKRNTYYTVTVDLAVVDTDSDYVTLNGSYVVTPWAEGLPAGGSNLGSARFFEVPQRSFELYSQDEVMIPIYSSSTVEAFFKQIKYRFYGDSSGGYYEYTFNYSDEAHMTSLTLNGATDTEGHPVPEKARETTSTPYTITIPAGSKYVRFSHPLTGIFTERTITLHIKNQEGAEADVTITQHPAIELKTRSTSNAFVNGWFARANADVRDADGHLMGVEFGPTQAFDSGQTRYHATSDWSGTYCTHFPQTGTNPMNVMGYIFGDNSSTTVAANTVYMTEITVSAFNETNDHFTIEYRNSTTYNGGTGTNITRYYKVGDPRVPVTTHYPGFTLPDYLYSDATHRDDPTYSEGNKFKSWQDAIDILIASQNADANEVIAPRFLVSSALNYISASIPHDGSMRRAACYQEAGYPAGRWRLPTEAEIAFIVARQKEGVIPELFASTYYHCANGRLVYVAKNNTNPPISVESQHGTATQVGCNRFVYDLWYWGDNPMDPSFYHPNEPKH